MLHLLTNFYTCAWHPILIFSTARDAAIQSTKVGLSSGRFSASSIVRGGDIGMTVPFLDLKAISALCSKAFALYRSCTNEREAVNIGDANLFARSAERLPDRPGQVQRLVRSVLVEFFTGRNSGPEVIAIQTTRYSLMSRRRHSYWHSQIFAFALNPQMQHTFPLVGSRTHFRVLPRSRDGKSSVCGARSRWPFNVFPGRRVSKARAWASPKLASALH